MNHQERGFTLIELMVTIVILAIIAMIAVPSFNATLQKNQLNVELRELSSILSQARSNAVLSKKNVTVNLNTSGLNTEEDLYWNPKNYLVYKSATTEITFGPEGTVNGFTSDIDLAICHSKLSLMKTISVTRMGTLLQKAEGACT